ncbi:protein erg27 [Aspergillus stella-maris]|uniref:protein erg27 n=1 Tax=Aspergillus stella-maris TaxID=1810926 RepID=UPI003CCD67C5
MASSEVDQKALGNFAAVTSLEHPFLSAMLYKILGLSVMLSNKLLRARRLRRLDPTRETKSLQLYYHIIWLSREGLLILEEFVLPLVDAGGFIELKILAFKLRASFYHIFVLFHNRPVVLSLGMGSLDSCAAGEGENDGDQSPKTNPNSRLSFRAHPEILSVFPTPPGAATAKISPKTHSQSTTHLKPPTAPPGLTPVQHPTPHRLSSSSFLLPALDYTLTATACFNHASLLADRFLPGSHPLRLSIKLEYAAYLHDCLQDPSASRKLAKQAIADVYNAQEGMDDESFEDAAEIVGLLGKMVKRGDKEKKQGKGKGTESVGTGVSIRSVSGTPSRAGGSGSGSVTPRAGDAESSRSEGGRTPTSTRTTVRKTSPRTAATTPIPSQSPRTPKIASSVSVSGGRGGHSGSPAVVPNPSMLNPI